MSQNKMTDECWKDVVKRAKGRCEYCGRNLLSSPEEFLLAQGDRIIPGSAGGDYSLKNCALSCYACNVLLKKAWNPGGSTPITSDVEREKCVKAVQLYVKERREEGKSVYREMKREVKGCLR